MWVSNITQHHPTSPMWVSNITQHHPMWVSNITSNITQHHNIPVRPVCVRSVRERDAPLSRPDYAQIRLSGISGAFQMIFKKRAIQVAVAILMMAHVYSEDLLKVKNAAEARDASIIYLRGLDSRMFPSRDTQWQERTTFSGGPQDMVTTAKQFTSDGWIIEIYQELAPLRNTVYQVTVFSSTEGWHWKGNIKADGSVSEVSLLRKLPEEDKRRTAEELLKKSRTAAPFGGYGH
jgi:hypothetical protein